MRQMSWDLAIKCIDTAETVKVEDSIFASWFDIASLLREVFLAVSAEPKDLVIDSLTISKMKLDTLTYPDGNQFIKQKLKVYAYNKKYTQFRDIQKRANYRRSMN